jgi:hypothetical protein
VYLLYQTAWVDEDGLLQFRNDIYGHDARLAAALRRDIAPKRGDSYAGNLSFEAPTALLQHLESHGEKFKPVKTLAN